jgi:hypothetical protein
MAAARWALGEEAYDAGWERGHTLPLEEVITTTLDSSE